MLKFTPILQLCYCYLTVPSTSAASHPHNPCYYRQIVEKTTKDVIIVPTEPALHEF